VKRPRTRKSLRGSLHSAVKQLRSTGLTAFVFVDFTLVLGLHLDTRPGNLDDVQDRITAVEPALRKLAGKGEVLRWIQERYKGDRVAGIIAGAHFAVPSHDGKTHYIVRRMIGGDLPGHRAKHAAEYMRSLFP
jgi:hypothetical protein